MHDDIVSILINSSAARVEVERECYEITCHSQQQVETSKAELVALLAMPEIVRLLSMDVSALQGLHIQKLREAYLWCV